MNWRTRRIVDNLWGPSGSFLFHLVVLIVLVNVVKVTRREVVSEVEVILQDVEPPQDLDDLEEELDQLEDIPTVVDAVAPPTVSVEEQPPQVDSLAPSPDAGLDMSDLDVLESVSPLRFKGLYASRSAAGRASALGKYSGGLGKRTEFAVLRALKWLRDHQDPDGSWGPQYRVAMTGLALLTFMAHGETTGSEEYGEAIARGLRYLLSRQQDGVFVGGGHVDYWHSTVRLQTQLKCYEHGIGAYAVSEAYGLMGIPFLKGAMEQAIQVIIDGQHEGGSWDYGYIHGPKSHVDVSLAGWHMQALKAAAFAGAENPGLKATIEAGIIGLKRMSLKKEGGLFAYSTRNDTHKPDLIMTGVGVLCMQLTGHAMDDETRLGTRALRSLRLHWSKDDRGVGSWPLYAWYYITQARFHQGGQTWSAWNRSFAPALCDMQNDNGSWCPAPDSDEARFGPVYNTALSTLMLEVYYRLLPTFQPIKVERDVGEDDDEDDEIVIRFG